LRLVLHRDIPEDTVLRNQWNALVEQMGRPEMFYTFEWALAMSRSYHASLKPLLCLGYQEDKLAGVAALATNAQGSETVFLSGATADYCDFVSSPQRRREFVNEVLAALRQMQGPKLVLANLPAESATLSALVSALPDSGYRFLSRPAYSCAQVSLRSTEERNTVRRSMLRRKSKRRQFASIEKIAPVKLDHLRCVTEIVQSLPDFVRMHVARCLFTRRLSNLLSSDRRAFVSELAELLSRAGWMTLSRLTVGDKVVAWNYGFQFAGSWFWYQPTFDVAWQQHSPGFYLLARIVEEACSDDAVKVVDLGLGNEPYKDRLANGRRHTLHVTATRSSREWAAGILRLHAVRAIGKLPQVEKSLRTARARGSDILARLRTSGLRATARWLLLQHQRVITGNEEIQFFEWPEDRLLWTGQNSSELRLGGVDLETLASAAMRYPDDEETLAYLLRSANRLRSGKSEAFALREADGSPVHFCWAEPFHTALASELSFKLSVPSERAVLLFDCWTPASFRGRGYCQQAISRLASQLNASGKRPWIFGSSTNTHLLRAIESAGLVPRFSVTRKWGRLRLQPSTATSIFPPRARAHASSAA